MLDSRSEYKETPRIYRVSVIPFFHIGDNDYLLLLKNRSRQEWETPGGANESHESPEETAAREIKEETGLDLPFSVTSVPYLPSEQSGRLPSQIIAGGSGADKEIVEFTCLADISLSQLPQINFDSQSEHDDYLFVKIPHFNNIQRKSKMLFSLFPQINQKKLVISKRRGHQAVLDTSANLFSIQSRRENISSLTSSSLRRCFGQYLHE
jgi:8-oxo-dGTP pyrophosphatase MutT (NUDIX family)